MSADILSRISGDDPVARLRSLREAVPGRIVFTTSFGIEDQAITHMIAEAGLDIHFATLDTGRLFDETREVWAETEDRYGIEVEAFRPDPDRLADYIDQWGMNGFYDAQDTRLLCCEIRKVEPLKRALAGAEAWITGLRADQSAGRNAVELASWDDARGLVKLAPIFDWSRERTAEFCAANAVPVNALHAKGYPSIGCAPCTRAVRPGEDERAGRWWWEGDDARECGLHLDEKGRLVPNRRAA
ncbi:MAG: phosphoadenylyl-sulfate reductase [Parasphingopyxis sp.]|nr:phosphoadenylyl-sulfate reductase [Sphingomonadales bacterium]